MGPCSWEKLSPERFNSPHRLLHLGPLSSSGFLSGKSFASIHSAMMRISTNQTAQFMCCAQCFRVSSRVTGRNPNVIGLGEGCNLQSEHALFPSCSLVMPAECAQSTCDIGITYFPLVLSAVSSAPCPHMSALSFVTFERSMNARHLSPFLSK